MKLNQLLDALMAEAAMQEIDSHNALIMTHWANIRMAAIEAGLFDDKSLI